MHNLKPCQINLQLNIGFEPKRLQNTASHKHP